MKIENLKRSLFKNEFLPCGETEICPAEPIKNSAIQAVRPPTFRVPSIFVVAQAANPTPAPAPTATPAPAVAPVMPPVPQPIFIPVNDQPPWPEANPQERSPTLRFRLSWFKKYGRIEPTPAHNNPADPCNKAEVTDKNCAGKRFVADALVLNPDKPATFPINFPYTYATNSEGRITLGLPENQLVQITRDQLNDAEIYISFQRDEKGNLTVNKIALDFGDNVRRPIFSLIPQ